MKYVNQQSAERVKLRGCCVNRVWAATGRQTLARQQKNLIKNKV